MTIESTSSTSAAGRVKQADDRLAALSALLNRLDEAAQSDGLYRPIDEDVHQSQLVKMRLGVASSLFAALRAKHPATAAHGLRVALGVSSWGLARQLSPIEQDECEIAALLHDIGKIGVSDRVLSTPRKLSGDDLLEMERQRFVGASILSGCCSSTRIIDLVLHANAWFDGSRHGFEIRGDNLPLGSRMIAIVDAFDAMTTEHIYRPAISQERAVAELFAYAGTQFDPQLVREFAEQMSSEKSQRDSLVARRWLSDLNPKSSNSFWTLQTVVGITDSAANVGHEFYERLVDSMCDGVVFVDCDLRIMSWNCAAERMTGLSAASLIGKQWLPSLVDMRDEHDRTLSEDNCPIRSCQHNGSQIFRRYGIANRQSQKLRVDLHVVPVVGRDGAMRGATMVLHDASSQISLEERVQSLHERATRDALTKAANRAELNRVLPEFMQTHLQKSLPCSMIICDIDHFKKINDMHGHQAGDEALVLFSNLLLRSARSGDLVARYGGEEFVVLCTDCDNGTATRRAEEIRRRVEATPMPSLGNQCITASFGVTEVQGGDTPETFLRRADRALLQAKSEGRNVVVQLGTGIAPEERVPQRGRWFSWLGASQAEILVERTLVTVVPLKVTAEKLRGFVADHNSEIVSIDGERVTLTIDGPHAPLMRRTTDRPVPFIIDLTFEEQQLPVEGRIQTTALRTLIRVVIRPKRQRDRRRRDAIERARQLLVSLKSYLMAQDHLQEEKPPAVPEVDESLLTKSKQLLAQWLR